MQIRKAERKQSKLRIGMAGPSGSGKTYSALKMARGLTDSWNKIAMIDTENKRGDLYSHLGDYNIITLEAPFTPERFIEAMHTCEQSGMEVIIIDSSSHEWEGPGGCLEINEKLAAAKFKGNTWAAWSETTPRHQRFINAIIASPCHVITTMRSKTDTIQTEDKKIKKVGLKEIQREGFEYELTVSFNIDRDNHYAVVGKDNTEIFKDCDPFLISEEHGKQIRAWSESGKVDDSPIKPITSTEPIQAPDIDDAVNMKKKAIMENLKRLSLQITTKEQAVSAVKTLTGLELIPENFDAIIALLNMTPQESAGTVDTTRPDMGITDEDLGITRPTPPSEPVEPGDPNKEPF